MERSGQPCGGPVKPFSVLGDIASAELRIHPGLTERAGN
jgi:hypothetical protein